ncbi:TMEM175 family protein [Microbacterium sp. EST19A]|uniref:TMEM175 family protein n=1 Tax=Microbacterium sp. EST19A TaxID=2862681 RepID=UPI001CC113FA|nr:TMEM175 family protein [Microbacterium sp. EST19A]
MADRRSGQQFSTERFKAFADAVVAIAMTLLILPLLESVSDAASKHVSTGEFLAEEWGQLFSFALSFLLIANFWMEHHNQYTAVRAVTPMLLWINIAWLATIVWLPVPTAMLGQMDTDPLQEVVYIGTLILTQITTFAAKLYLLRHPDLTTAPASRIRLDIAGDVASIILFAAALAIAVSIGGKGYFALLLLLLTGVFAKLLYRIWMRASPRQADDTVDEASGDGEPEKPATRG